MNPLSLARPLSTALAVTLCLSACSTFGGKKDSLSQVDDLVARIERVYVECELSNEKAQEALGALQTIVAPEFEGDASTAYEELVMAIERSEKQAKKLTASVGPMERSAEAFFAQWTTDLDEFTSLNMRKRSQARLEATRARYSEIAASVVPAREAFDFFNAGLRDHMLYLGNDFNPEALADIASEVDVLADQADALSAELEMCLVAALKYTQSTGLPEQQVAAGTSTSDEPEVEQEN